jgi:hypothetical protein
MMKFIWFLDWPNLDGELDSIQFMNVELNEINNNIDISKYK